MNNTLRPNPRRAGFTLTEVLIAMGILALGIVAVASLFPTGALLQKEAVKETLRQNHVRSGDAILEGVGINNITLLEFMELIESEPAGYPAYDVRDDMDDPTYDVFALAEVDTTVWSSFDDLSDLVPPQYIPASVPEDEASGNTNLSPASLVGTPDMTNGSVDSTSSFIYDTLKYPSGNFSIGLRSLPSITPADDANDYSEREVFFVPLIRQGIEASEIFPDWNVYLFILQPPSQLREQGAYNITNYSPGFDGLICANPLDGFSSATVDQGYVPKVFRVPVDWDDADPNIITPLDATGAQLDLSGFLKAGELVLGDNGKIYRIGKFNPGGNQILLDSQTLYEPINERDLTAIWCAPAPGGINEDSPLGDLRLLSNGVVRAPIQ